ncbi:MAG: hypothetical protein SVW77_02670 [Candidatus Nanohaloarchaea archaeon]|nr:hypothetical protein [Candidatus Nanohaloarchaea archaeon]
MTRSRTGLTPQVVAGLLILILLGVATGFFLGDHVKPFVDSWTDRIGLTGNSCTVSRAEDGVQCTGELSDCTTIKDQSLCGAVQGCQWAAGPRACIEVPDVEPSCDGLSPEQCRQVS